MQTLTDATTLPHLIMLLQDPWLRFGWNRYETFVLLAYLVAASGLTAWHLRD
jgi:hypothetical protein